MDITDRLEYAFNAELIKRLLIRYFSEKGFQENFDLKVYPPSIQDLCESVPELSGKVELEPHAKEIDPTTGFAKIGWNLFVLGNQRMYLGETEHNELQDLARQLESKTFVVNENEDATTKTCRHARTARDIVGWIVRVLGNSEAGLVRSNAASEIKPGPLGNSNAGQFYQRPKAIRPEGQH